MVQEQNQAQRKRGFVEKNVVQWSAAMRWSKLWI